VVSRCVAVSFPFTHRASLALCACRSLPPLLSSFVISSALLSPLISSPPLSAPRCSVLLSAPFLPLSSHILPLRCSPLLACSPLLSSCLFISSPTHTPSPCRTVLCLVLLSLLSRRCQSYFLPPHRLPAQQHVPPHSSISIISYDLSPPPPDLL